MKTNRRRFLETNLLIGVGASLPFSATSANTPQPVTKTANPRYAKLDEVLRQPVLKRELFP